MSDHVYKSLEITGSSSESIDDAVRTAVAKASQSLRHLDWFELVAVRGNLEDGAGLALPGHHQDRVPARIGGSGDMSADTKTSETARTPAPGLQGVPRHHRPLRERRDGDHRRSRGSVIRHDGERRVLVVARAADAAGLPEQDVLDRAGDRGGAPLRRQHPRARGRRTRRCVSPARATSSPGSGSSAASPASRSSATRWPTWNAASSRR